MPEIGQAAVRIWNLMDGRIDWPALPLLADLCHVDDIETLIDWLTEIRKQRTPPKDHARVE